jgi:hypothetical protein
MAAKTEYDRWMRVLLSSLAALIAVAGCGSKSGAGSDAGAADLAGAPMFTEHGVMLDYDTLKPVAGLTVTDGDASTTTDAMGQWSLTRTAAALAPVVTGASYSKVIFPLSNPVGADIDFGPQVIPTANTYNLEEVVLAQDTTKALVHIVALTGGTCSDPSGATLTLLSPAGATLIYFDPSSYPNMQAKTTLKVTAPRPLAVVINVTPGADVTFTFQHPTCTQVPWPATFNGKAITGMVPTLAAEPDHINSALAMVLM